LKVIHVVEIYGEILGMINYHISGGRPIRQQQF